MHLELISDELPPLRQERPPSPPPAYDEVTKQRPLAKVDGISSNDVKIDIGNESPPGYAAAIAMSSTQSSDQVPTFFPRFILRIILKPSKKSR